MAVNSWPPSCSECDTCLRRESKQTRYLNLSVQYNKVDEELKRSSKLSALGGALISAASIAAVFVPGMGLVPLLQSGRGRRGQAAGRGGGPEEEDQKSQKLRRLEELYLELNALSSEISSMTCPFGGRQQAGGYVVSGQPGQGGFEGGGRGGFVPQNQPYQGYDRQIAGPGSIGGHYNVASGGQFDQPGSGRGQFNPPPQSTGGARVNTMGSGGPGGYTGNFNSQPNTMSPRPVAFSGNYDNLQPADRAMSGPGSVSGNRNMGYNPSPNPASFSSGRMAPAPVGGPYSQPPGMEFVSRPGSSSSSRSQFGAPGMNGPPYPMEFDSRPGSSGSSRSQFGAPGRNGPPYPTECDSRPGSSGSSRNQFGMNGPLCLAPETRFSPGPTQMLQQQDMSSSVNNGPFHERNSSFGRPSSEFSRRVVDGLFNEAARPQSSSPYQEVYAAPGGGVGYVYGQQQFVEPGRPGSSGGHNNPNVVPTGSQAKVFDDEADSSEESDDEEEEIPQQQQHPRNGDAQHQQQKDPNQQLQAEPIPVIHENGQYPQRGNANVQYQPQPTVAPPGLGPPELRSVDPEDSSSSDDEEEDDDDDDLHEQKPRQVPMAADLKVPVQDAQQGMRLDDGTLQRQALDRASMPQTTSSTSYDRHPAYATDPRALQQQVRPRDSYLPTTVQDFQEGTRLQDEHLQRRTSIAGGVPQGMAATSYERGPAPPVYGSVMQQKTSSRAVDLTVPVQEFQQGMRLQDGPRGPRAPLEVQPRKVGHRQGSEARRAGPEGPYQPQREVPALHVARVVPPGVAGAPPSLYVCNSCTRQLRPQEYRYNCNTCKTLDLCSGCYSRREIYHPYHKEFTQSMV